MQCRSLCEVRWLVMVCVTVVLAACGGGGGSAPTDNAPPPEYTGVTSQAVVTQGNAEELALVGYGGGGVADALASTLGARVEGGERTSDLRLRQLIESVKRSTRQMDIPRLAREAQTGNQTAPGVLSATRVENYQIPGDAGGYATYMFFFNDATGSFTGSIIYSAFSSQGVVLNGTSEMKGSLDVTHQDVSWLTLTFKALSIHYDSVEMTLVGSLTWGFNYAASTENLTVNMVLVDLVDMKAYWYRDYKIVSVYGDQSVSMTLSGRSYDPNYGYVVITTESPVVIFYSDSWPVQGCLRFAGGLGTSVRQTFLDRTTSIEADSDGNGVVDWQTERPTNIRPFVNNQPVADAGADQNVQQGTPIVLNGSLSYDPDGDLLSYNWSFTACPQYSCPVLTDSTTATPSFVPEIPGTYELRLTVFDSQSASLPNTVSVAVSPAAPTAPDLLKLQWEYGTYGTYIGLAGLQTADLDGNGSLEIVASASPSGFGSNRFWYVVRQAVEGGYEQTWRSDTYPVTLVRLLADDLDGDGNDDVVAGLADGSVRIYAGPDLQEVRRFVAGASLRTLGVADLEGDGRKEIIATDGFALSVYAAESGALEWSIPSGGGNALAVGNVDGDTALEIVATTGGGKGYVVDGHSHAVEWEYIDSFGARVELGDLDGDGMQEIVAASDWERITVFDAERKTPAWELPTSHDIGALLVRDVSGDGIAEILYGDGQWGSVHAIDARSRGEIWALRNPEHGVSGIAWGDVDDDGQQEVLWGAGGSSTGPDYLFVANPAIATIEWQSMHVDGPFSAVAVGDVDDDGEDEVVMVSRESESGYGEGVIHIFNARTNVVEYREALGTMDWMGVRSVRIGDVDDDGKTDFVVTTASIYDGLIRVYDGASHEIKGQTPSFSGNFFSNVAIGDVDGDGRTEIVAGQGREHTGAAGVYLLVFDGATLQEKWRSTDLGSYWGMVYDLKLADPDRDGRRDIIATVTGDRLFIYDGVTHDLKLLLNHPGRAVEVADIDADGNDEILLGRTDGKVDVYDGTTFDFERSVATFSSAPVDALQVADLDGNTTKEWLLASGECLIVLEGSGQGLKWRSPVLAGNLGLHNHLAVDDSDGDGRSEVSVGSDIALYRFE